MEKCMTNNSRLCFLNGNALKIIAAVTMLIDHMGYILFPQYKIFRIVGRLSFPIYAFMISEGCFYTKNKSKYFWNIFSLAFLCQIVSYIFNKNLDMGILVTYSLSIPVIYALGHLKEMLCSPDSTCLQNFKAFVIFALSVVTVYFLNKYLTIDYGFWGCMTPVFAFAFKKTRQNSCAFLEKTDSLPINVFMMGICLVILSLVLGKIQIYSLFALPIIMLYSGKRGKTNMKMFFYVFYPAHLVILQGIKILLQG